MALKIRTVMTYPLTGAVDFAITFEYLARKFVTVTLIGKDRKELVLNQDYRFTTKTQITTTRTWTAADGYDSIEIRRYTSATDRLVDFADGSILRAYDLNVAQIQTLHVAEEARDLTADTIGVNNDGHLDARGRRIVNVANPVDDGDAVNLRSLKVWNDSALNSANRAEQKRNEAEQFRNEAGEHRNVAESAKDQAIAARGVAESAKDQAISAKNQAESARDLAAGSRDESLSFAEESNQHMGLAKKWAINPVDVVVQDGEYSAKHWQHYSKVEADRSESEADRATTEANKLGNMNDFAGTIKSVDVETSNITFKGSLETDGGITAHGASEVNSLTVSKDAVIAGDSWLHKTNVDGNLSVTSDATVKGRLTSYSMVPENLSNGQYINTNAIRSKLMGRGGNFEPDGAYCALYFQEEVGNTHRVILNLNGFDRDTNWQFSADGKIHTPYGEVQTAGSDIRIKSEVDPAPEGSGERIDGIGLVEYTEIGTGRRRRGWIAQQVYTVDPMYAYLSGDLMNTDDRAMLADLIAAVQELRQRVAELEADKE